MEDSTTVLYNIHTCQIYTNMNGGLVNNGCPSNLFTHPFFYIQNNIVDEKTRNYVKCFLYLHTLRYDFIELSKLNTCFNQKDSKGGFETLPLGYLYFLGGLVWRKNCNSDPVIYKEGNISYKHPETKSGTFLHFNLDKHHSFFMVNEGEGTVSNLQPYNNLIKFTNEPLFENKLENLFKDFADSQFIEILNHCELKKEKDGKKENLTGNDIKSIINLLSNNFYSNNEYGNSRSTDLLKGKYRVNNEYTVSNFTDNYVLGFVEGNCLFSFFSDSNPISGIFSSFYATDCLVVSLPSNKKKEIPKNALTSYFAGMSTVFENSEKLNQQQQAVEKDIIKDTEDVRDFKCEIYLTLKNIWDRWLCGYYNNNGDTGLNMFNVENFFDKNFVFIDSFYNNIYDVLKLNCKVLENLYTDKITNQATKLGSSTVAYLGSVASAHMSMMFNFPDNVNFMEIDRRGNNHKSVDMIQNMKEVFTPIPSNMVTEPEYANKFTIIYTHSANKLDTVDRNKFNHDSFDIWSFNEGTDVAPAVFKGSPASLDSETIDSLTNGSRIAYKVPAFGVAYSRQNNSLWKNIQISMDNFTVTEQAVRAEAYIANKGASEPHNITYYGQDIYSLYQAYSYLVTIEMMGDAQIQPLMYFQLMNVPMFRGTYMIIKVEHRITPGNMTTIFTGMKMSKVQPPYAKDWITKSSKGYIAKPPSANMDTSADTRSVLIDSNGNAVNIKDDKFELAVKENLSQAVVYCDDFVKDVYKSYATKTKTKIPFEGDLTANSQQNMLNWLKNSSVWSVHEFPTLINNNYNEMISGSNRPRVGDLLFGYHDDRVTGKHDHVAIYLGVHGGKHYVAEGKSRSGTKINEENTASPGMPQVVDITVSRLSLNSDYITHFATCNKVAQTDASSNYIGTVIAESSGEMPKYVVDDSGDLRPFNFKFENNSKSLVYSKKAETLKVITKQTGLSDDVKSSLTTLVTIILKPLNVVVETKDGYNYTGHLHITSGYRCPEVNHALSGHSDISQHMKGEAADFQILGGNMYEENKQIIKTIIQWMQNESINFKFGQLIIYNQKDGTDKNLEYVVQHTRYMHISLGNKCEIKWNNGSIKPIDTTAQEVMAIINSQSSQS